jgi:hypothetical protein
MKRMAASNLLNVVLAATALRLAAYAVLPAAGTPWAVLPVELLHVSVLCLRDFFCHLYNARLYNASWIHLCFCWLAVVFDQPYQYRVVSPAWLSSVLLIRICTAC